MDAYEALVPEELIKLALGELKSASIEAPASRRAAIEEKIKRAEEMLTMARSKSAKEQGFRLHDCKYPAPLFLWNEQQQAHICENCGQVRPKAKPVPVGRRSSWINARRGDGTGWMGN